MPLHGKHATPPPSIRRAGCSPQWLVDAVFSCLSVVLPPPRSPPWPHTNPFPVLTPADPTRRTCTACACRLCASSASSRWYSPSLSACTSGGGPEPAAPPPSPPSPPPPASPPPPFFPLRSSFRSRSARCSAASAAITLCRTFCTAVRRGGSRSPSSSAPCAGPSSLAAKPPEPPRPSPARACSGCSASSPPPTSASLTRLALRGDNTTDTCPAAAAAAAAAAVAAVEAAPRAAAAAAGGGGEWRCSCA